MIPSLETPSDPRGGAFQNTDTLNEETALKQYRSIGKWRHSRSEQVMEARQVRSIQASDAI